MALTVTIDGEVQLGAQMTKGDRRMRQIMGTMDFDRSYPTGGEALPSTFPLTTIKGMKIETKSGYMFECDRSAKKIKAFHPRAAITNTLAASVNAGATSVTSTAANGAIITLSGNAGVAAGPGAEVPNLTNLSALTGVGFIAWGW